MAWFTAGEAYGLVGLVGVAESPKATLDVERQPAGKLRVRRVLPEAVPAAAPGHIVNQVAQVVVVGRETAARGKVEQEDGVSGHVEGERTRGRLPADQPG